jgi:hypothetical protein
MAMVYSLKDLRKMTLAELADVGERLGLNFTKNHAKAKRVTMIVARQAELVVEKSPEPGKPADPAIDAPVRPEFEALVDGDDGATAFDGSPTACQRGGPRPGAGRPFGMTEEKARMAQLSETPHPVIEEGVAWLYGGWACLTGCPDVALNPDELEDNALALTNAGEYIGVVQKIPPWLKLWLTLFVTVVGTVRNKARIAREYRAKQRSAQGAERAAGGSEARAGDVPA